MKAFAPTKVRRCFSSETGQLSHKLSASAVVAKMAGLGYPGGPAVEKAARSGDPARFALPRPMRGKPGFDFSFSGLKNATRLLIESLPQPLALQDQADVAAAFQLAVAESIADRTRRAAREVKSRWPQARHLVVAGGVAANTVLRQTLVRIGTETGLEFLAPPLALCTDNAAMIAWAGIERLQLGLVDDLSFAPRPRWPLDPNAKKVGFAGAKA